MFLLHLLALLLIPLLPTHNCWWSFVRPSPQPLERLTDRTMCPCCRSRRYPEAPRGRGRLRRRGLLQLQHAVRQGQEEEADRHLWPRALLLLHVPQRGLSALHSQRPGGWVYSTPSYQLTVCECTIPGRNNGIICLGERYRKSINNGIKRKRIDEEEHLLAWSIVWINNW